MIEVSIIIVNYNSTKMCVDAVRSIATHCMGDNHEIIVIDNNSNKADKMALAEISGFCKVLYNPENVGFGRANNIAASMAAGSHLLFLNPDTLALNDIAALFHNSLTELETKYQVGILGCYQRNQDMSFNHSSGSFTSHHYTAFLKNEFRQNILKQLREPLRKLSKEKAKKENPAREPELQKVDWVNGACLFIKKSVFESIGGFDGDFFLFSEEVDLQKRLANKGYEQFLVTEPSIIHLHEDKRKMSGKTRVFFYNGYFTYAKKYFTAIEYSVTKAIFFMMVAFSAILDFFTKRYSFLENLALLKSLIIPSNKHA